MAELKPCRQCGVPCVRVDYKGGPACPQHGGLPPPVVLPPLRAGNDPTTRPGGVRVLKSGVSNHEGAAGSFTIDPQAARQRALRDDIRDVLNKHSAENGSDTPDFILANYLLGCLAAFDEATELRTAWHTPEIGENDGN